MSDEKKIKLLKRKRANTKVAHGKNYIEFMDIASENAQGSIR